MKTIAFLLSACLLLGSAAAGAAPSDAEQLQTDAYVQVVQGDQSFDAGRLDEALGQYQEAKRLYERLAAGFPDWEPRIVRYRAAYCDNRIAEINQRVGERAAFTSAQTAATAPAAYYGAQPDYDSGYAPAPLPPATAAGVPESLYQSALRRADALQSQLDSARNAEQQARAELARVRGDLDRANRSLSQRSVEADSELARLRDLQSRQQAETHSLRAENERLKAQLASKADLEGALNDVERQLNRVRGENRELQDQLADLRQDLEDCEARVAQAAEIAAEAQSRAAAAVAAPETAPAPEPEAAPEAPAFDPAAFDWPEPAAEEDFADDESIPELREDEDALDDEPAPAPAPAAAPAAPAERVVATWPARPIPRGMEAADFVRVLLANGETETAFATVQKAREDAPDDAALATLEGIVLIRLQHYAAAAELLHALSVEHPDDAAIHANLGAAWLGEGFYAGAREALRNAIELNPDIGGEYYYNLALVCAMTEPRDLDTARDAYRKALDAGVAPDPQLDAILP